MKTLNALKSFMRDTIRVAFPNNEILETQELDRIAWERLVEDDFNSMNLETPLILLVETDNSNVDNPFTGSIGARSTVHSFNIYYVMSATDCYNAKITSLAGANINVDSTTNLYAEQILYTDTIKKEVVSFLGNVVTLDSNYGSTPTFPVRVYSRIEDDVVNKIELLRRTFIDAQGCVVDNATMLRDIPINSASNNPLNRKFAGNGIEKWSASLSISFVTFYG